MRALRSWLGLLGTLALAGLPAPAGAQAVGSEFQINTYTTSTQRTVSTGGKLVAADANGSFVVVWQSLGQDGSGYGVLGQRYDNAGEPLGSEFRVNSFTNRDQKHPSVAAAADGDFVVVWQSYQDGSNDGIFAQRYDSAGVPVGVEFRVNSHTTSQQQRPSVASDASGNFVVVWDSFGPDGSSRGIVGQRYDSAGEALGSEFRINSYTTGIQWFPSVASDASGNFVVVWTSVAQYEYSNGVFGQRYDSSGEAQGNEFSVNSYTTGPQDCAAVASDATGNFVVVWNSFQDGSGSGIFAQRYDSEGGVRGTEFRINTYTTGQQIFPSIASDAGGNFVVVWESEIQDGSNAGVFGQRYDSAGMAQGEEFQINAFTTGQQRYPSLGAAGPNQFVMAWASFGQDGSGYGVFGQRFDFGAGASTLHVGDLDQRGKNIGAQWRPQVKTTVHDAGHNPTAGVLVTMNISGFGTRTCTTQANGICEVTVTVSDVVPNVTFTVTNLSKAAFTYDPGSNHDPDPDSNGTVIVVNQP